MESDSVTASAATGAGSSGATSSASSDVEIVAYAGSWYRKARYIMAVICFALAGWFAYDGWVNWPEQNRRYDEIVARKEKPDFTKHSDTDLVMQRALAVTLPVLALGIIGWLLFNSRGCYRLANDVLYAPGHPPVPLSAIREIDKSKWDKKGIAYLDYELDDPSGGKPKTGTIVLDDFVYQQGPTDEIVKTIEVKVTPPVEADAEKASERSASQS